MSKGVRVLSVENVSRQIGGIAALTNLTLNIEENCVLGVVGPNGAGKSTLLEIISGFQKPNSGDIFFKGMCINQLRPDQRCRLGICRTFQSIEAFLDLTVLENALIGAFVRCASRRDAITLASFALQQVGLLAKSDLPARLLNQSDLKRLDLARALATKPTLLLLDEVLAGLDSADIQEISDLIERTSQLNISIVIVEHNLSAIQKLATRVAILDRGHLILEGSPQEVFRNPQVVDIYIGR